MIDRLQRGAERLAQLQANAAEAATALQAARDSLATLEAEQVRPADEATLATLEAEATEKEAEATEKELATVTAQQAEKTKEVEALRLEKVTTDTRLMMIRKTLVRTSLCGEA